MVDKWFALQATAQRPDALDAVSALLHHEAFTLANPNRVRSLIGAFAQGNPTSFHRADGAGYAFVADHVLALDKRNPQVASRLAQPFGRWRRYDRAAPGAYAGRNSSAFLRPKASRATSTRSRAKA